MRPYHPDDSNMRWLGQGRGGQGGGNGGGGGGLLSPFLPGNKGLLAQQLSAGFGGKPAQYSQHFNQLYQPMPTGFFQPGSFGGGGAGNGGGNGTGVTSGGETMPKFKNQKDIYEWIRRFGTPTDPGSNGYGSYLGGGSR